VTRIPGPLLSSRLRTGGSDGTGLPTRLAGAPAEKAGHIAQLVPAASLRFRIPIAVSTEPGQIAPKQTPTSFRQIDISICCSALMPLTPQPTSARLLPAAHEDAKHAGDATGRSGGPSTDCVPFRAKHKPYTRIPLVLQTAVAKAHSRGATEMELRDACGISAAQFQRWTSRARGSSERCVSVREQLPEVRFFDVVEGIDGRPPTSSVRPRVERGLELRLGTWSIRVSLANA
jgi:hypothetical protein